MNVFVNEVIENVYFLIGDGKLENKRINMGNEEDKVINNEQNQPNRETAISIFNKLILFLDNCNLILEEVMQVKMRMKCNFLFEIIK